MKRFMLLTGLIIVFLLLFTNSLFSYTLFHQEPHPKILPKPPPYSELTKIIQKKQPRLTKETANQIAKAVHKYSKPFPPKLILAIIEKESSFLPKQTSKIGCVGLMQIYPEMHPNKVKGFSRKELYDIDTNVKIGCMILREYYTKTKTISRALYRYRGAKHKGYVLDILSSFADMHIAKK